LTGVVILCLALGIGGTLTVFSMADAVLFRSLPYRDPERLVLVRSNHPSPGFDTGGRVSQAELRDWQAAGSFESIAGYRYMTLDLIDPERSERLEGLLVTPEFFSILDVQAGAGRLLKDGKLTGLILGRGLWERRFGLDPDIVGESLPIGICCPQKPQTLPLTVSGTMTQHLAFPPTLRGLRDAGHGLNQTIDYIGPLPSSNQRRQRDLEVIAKLRSGVSIAQAQAEIDAIAGRLEERFPDSNAGWRMRLVPIHAEIFETARLPILLLMGAAALVLMIACANAAVLLTLNAVTRFHEIAVRLALGAGSRGLIRQFLIESILVTSAACVIGVLIAISLKGVLIDVAPANLPRMNQISVDLRVLGFAIVVTIGSGLLVGLIPILRVLKLDIESLLRSENGRNATSHRRARTYEPLLTLQVALTLALMIGSGLMLKTFRELFAVPMGFQPGNVLTTTLSLPSAKHEWRYNAVFSERVLERVRALPGVEAAGTIRGLPMNESRFENRFQRWDRPADGSAPPVRLRVVSPGYFNAIGISMVVGRDFVADDGHGEIGMTRVIVINEAMARQFWPGTNPVGQRVTVGDSEQPIEVVGVVGNARYASIEAEPVPEIYYPSGSFPQDQTSLVVRTTEGSSGMSEAIRAAILEVERDVFIGPFQTLDYLIASSVSNRRLLLMLLNVFAIIGLLLAGVGIAGMVGYSLSLRTREVGIRVAMGATPLNIAMLISRQGLIPAIVGLFPGIVLALILAQLLSHMLYGVSPYDFQVFALATAALAFVSALTATITAWRARGIDASAVLK
jgi:predicted permease